MLKEIMKMIFRLKRKLQRLQKLHFAEYFCTVPLVSLVEKLEIRYIQSSMPMAKFL